MRGMLSELTFSKAAASANLPIKIAGGGLYSFTDHKTI